MTATEKTTVGILAAATALLLVRNTKGTSGVGAALPRYQVRAKLIDAYNKKHSMYGNPSYELMLVTEDGRYLRGRTEPNAQLGYVIGGNYYLKETFNTWTYTEGKRGIVFQSVDKYYRN